MAERQRGVDAGLLQEPGDALLIVDVQRDFLPGGALAVPAGDEVIPALNRYLERAARSGVPVFASRDWHPRDHCSFRERGGIWPPHCVAGTPGAELARDLRTTQGTRIIDKATRPDEEAYSAFSGTDLARQLRLLGIRRLAIGGLATDYCVLGTVRDALAAGFAVVLLADAIRAVDVHPGDGEEAIRRMLEAGATLTTADEPAR